MHGLGNDFVVFDAVRQDLHLAPEQVRFLADRRRGVGCDQVLLAEVARDPAADFFYRIYNADGSEAEQCGNGARCLARFLRETGLTDKDNIVLETRAGPIEVHMEGVDSITVNMGVPGFNPPEIPFVAEGEAPSYRVDVGDGSIELGAVSLGNPHAVVLVDDVDQAPVEELGAALEPHSRFPRRANVGFVQIQDSSHIRLRVYERGAGETLACGSGACAAVAVGRQQGRLDAMVSVELPGGELSIRWSGGDSPIWMRGPATRVFEGRIEL